MAVLHLSKENSLMKNMMHLETDINIVPTQLQLLSIYHLSLYDHMHHAYIVLILQISNFWPTISDLQKDWLLIRYIYKTVVCLLIQLRIIDIFLYFKYFTHTPLHQQRMWYRVLNTINLMCAIALLYLYHTAFFVSLGDSASKCMHETIGICI